MQESYGEDLASRSGLEPYADCGDAVGVASAKGPGRPAIELRNQSSRVPTLWCLWEGYLREGDMASQRGTRRSRRTCACLGHFQRENRETLLVSTSAAQRIIR